MKKSTEENGAALQATFARIPQNGRPPFDKAKWGKHKAIVAEY